MLLKIEDLKEVYTISVIDDSGAVQERIKLNKISKLIIKHHIKELRNKYKIKKISHYEEGFTLEDIRR